MTKTFRWKGFISLVLCISIMLSVCACSGNSQNLGLSDPTSKAEVEHTETENEITENIINEHITTENYLDEIVLAENKISELLLEENTISEVLLCKAIYVPQDNIDDFSEHSQISTLFGEEINPKSLLSKAAVGTGVIVTLVVLKRVGFSEPIVSAIASAADKSMKFGKDGAIIGSLFGGVTGATDEIDKSGRTSAAISFAMATAGLILSIVSLVGEIPSGGSTTMTLAAGIKLVIAGVSTLSATAVTAKEAKDTVKTFTSTDSTDIDWDNIDWNKVGISSAKKAINNGADGFMLGSLIGAVYGGADGYDYYQKYNTPYTKYDDRVNQTPINEKTGRWSGERGESEFTLDKPIKLEDGTTIPKVTYKNGVPDFSPYQKAQVKINNMTDSRHNNFKQANEALAKYWSKIKYDGKEWTARSVEKYRKANHLTWHEMSNMDSMQLVPYEVNARFTHCGGVSEYNAMIGKEGASDFD